MTSYVENSLWDSTRVVKVTDPRMTLKTDPRCHRDKCATDQVSIISSIFFSSTTLSHFLIWLNNNYLIESISTNHFSVIIFYSVNSFTSTSYCVILAYYVFAVWFRRTGIHRTSGKILEIKRQSIMLVRLHVFILLTNIDWRRNRVRRILFWQK